MSRAESFVTRHMGSIFVSVSSIAITGSISLIWQLHTQSEITKKQFEYLNEKISEIRMDVKSTHREVRERMDEHEALKEKVGNHEIRFKDIENRVDRIVNRIR
jgi:septal ring factor EnvC (AmiA/AmiB activator)